jgi:hypothetical protein
MVARRLGTGMLVEAGALDRPSQLDDRSSPLPADPRMALAGWAEVGFRPAHLPPSTISLQPQALLALWAVGGGKSHYSGPYILFLPLYIKRERGRAQNARNPYGY